jgi:putative molybdopterin biosynthesis protein
MARTGSLVGVVALPCSSGKALASLAEGSVHAAGVHLRDPQSADYNFAPVRRAIGRRRRMRLVNFARWEVGLVTSQGNPRGIRNFCDLARPNVKIVNRDRGSGARQVLDEVLADAALNPEAMAGYRDEVGGHLDVAGAVHAGHAKSEEKVRLSAHGPIKCGRTCTSMTTTSRSRP